MCLSRLSSRDCQASRAAAIEKAESVLLSTKGRKVQAGIEWAKRGGRSPGGPERDAWRLEEGQAPEGEVLQLKVKTQAMSRVKRSKGPMDWSKQEGRFAPVSGEVALV